jgi:hypothetical protein
VAGRPELLFGKVIVVVRVLEFFESIAIQVKSGDEAEIMRCFGKSRHILDRPTVFLTDVLRNNGLFQPSSSALHCYEESSNRKTTADFHKWLAYRKQITSKSERRRLGKSDTI